jgi:hypothetical protein
MGQLTVTERSEQRMLHCRNFDAVCDRCGHLILSGDLYRVTKWGKRADSLKFLGPVALRTFCQDEEECLRRSSAEAAAKEQPTVDVKKKPRTQKEKKMALKEKLARFPIEPTIRRAVLHVLAETDRKYGTPELFVALRRSKKLRQYKKGIVSATLRGMKIKKEIACKGKVWRLL